MIRSLGGSHLSLRVGNGDGKGGCLLGWGRLRKEASRSREGKCGSSTGRFGTGSRNGGKRLRRALDSWICFYVIDLNKILIYVVLSGIKKSMKDFLVMGIREREGLFGEIMMGSIFNGGFVRRNIIWEGKLISEWGCLDDGFFFQIIQIPLIFNVKFIFLIAQKIIATNKRF